MLRVSFFPFIIVFVLRILFTFLPMSQRASGLQNSTTEEQSLQHTFEQVITDDELDHVVKESLRYRRTSPLTRNHWGTASYPVLYCHCSKPAAPIQCFLQTGHKMDYH